METAVRTLPAEVRLSPTDVKSILPHRGRALHIRGATVRVEERHGWANRRITRRDCAGHFPGTPIFPGKECPEMIAQLLGIIVATIESQSGGQGFLASVGSCRFHSPARPGDRVKIDAWLMRNTPRRIAGKGEVRLADGTLVASIDNLLVLRQSATTTPTAENG